MQWALSTCWTYRAKPVKNEIVSDRRFLFHRLQLPVHHLHTVPHTRHQQQSPKACSVLLWSTHKETTTTQRPFNGLCSGTTRVGRYQKKHSPTHTHPDHRASFITFLHFTYTKRINRNWRQVNRDSGMPVHGRTHTRINACMYVCTDGRTTRKHNASSPFCWLDGGITSQLTDGHRPCLSSCRTSQQTCQSHASAQYQEHAHCSPSVPHTQELQTSSLTSHSQIWFSTQITM